MCNTNDNNRIPPYSNDSMIFENNNDNSPIFTAEDMDIVASIIDMDTDNSNMEPFNNFTEEYNYIDINNKESLFNSSNTILEGSGINMTSSETYTSISVPISQIDNTTTLKDDENNKICHLDVIDYASPECLSKLSVFTVPTITRRLCVNTDKMTQEYPVRSYQLRYQRISNMKKKKPKLKPDAMYVVEITYLLLIFISVCFI
jgi:hypothetical protein